MRIEKVEVWLLQHQLEKPLGIARGDQWNRYTALVRLRTEDGLEGWGEGLTDARLWPAFEAIVTQAWGPLVKQADIWDGERLWRKAFESMVYWEQKGVAIAAPPKRTVCISSARRPAVCTNSTGSRFGHVKWMICSQHNAAYAHQFD